MTIISRAEWGAKAPKYRATLPSTINGWFWHWLGPASPEGTSSKKMLQGAQNYHMGTKGWSDIAYNFAVDRDGLAYELRGWDIQGGATSGFNNTSMAILFLIGEGQKPTPAQFKAAYGIMEMRPEMTKLRSHRDVVSTSCPGDDIANEIKTPQYKESPMTPDQAKAFVVEAYNGLLAQTPDAGGVKYWTDRLLNGLPVSELRFAFLLVRLAADKAVVNALAASPGNVNVDTAALAEKTYQLFLSKLVELAK